jgi:putative ABC transport system substrate-binding protein
MKRRDFITLVGGAAAAYPLGVRAEQAPRRIGALLPTRADDMQSKVRLDAFLQELHRLGWIEGNNIRMDVRWTSGNEAETRKHAFELAAVTPDLILGSGSAAVGPLLQATRTIPIVFAIVPDPVGAGFVDNLARPGRNVTGFMTFEPGIGAKWLELLKELVPGLTRAAIIRDPAITAGIGQWSAIQALAPSLRVEVTPVNVRDPREIERAVGAFAGSAGAGMILTGSALAVVHRELIISLASRHKLPTIYYERYFAAAGGLISYGPDFVDQYRRAAAYVDRILKGEKPADLPVQAPTKYELVINLKTAKALGIELPASVLARADEVIE